MGNKSKALWRWQDGSTNQRSVDRRWWWGQSKTDFAWGILVVFMLLLLRIKYNKSPHFFRNFENCWVI